MPAVVLAAEQSCLVHPALCTRKSVVKLLPYDTAVLQKPQPHSQSQVLAQGNPSVNYGREHLPHDNATGCDAHQQACKTSFVSHEGSPC